MKILFTTLILLTSITVQAEVAPTLADTVFKPTKAECAQAESETAAFFENMTPDQVEAYTSSRDEALKEVTASQMPKVDTFLFDLISMHNGDQKSAVLEWIQRERSLNCATQNYID